MESNQQPSSMYLELLKKTLIDYSNINSIEYYPLSIVKSSWKIKILRLPDILLRFRNFAIVKVKPVSEEKRMNGYDWPANADTMIGLQRLNNIENCFNTIVQENIEGDLIEAGVWRGGATIFMRALLKNAGITTRKVWVADSFKGLPKPDTSNYPSDQGNKLHTYNIFSVSLNEVRANFEKYDLLDSQVVFLEGWFKDTLPDAPIDKLSLIRLDSDMYESTFQSLKYLYPKLVPGGFIIIDDYNAFQNCKQAVSDFRTENNIDEEIIEIDKEAIYWRKIK